jgi:septum formation protein
MYQTRMNLILASASPRRRELLSRMGLKFSVMPSDLEEETELTCSEREPVIHVQNCARDKVERVAKLVSEQKEFWFLGMDTIVVIDELILGKPRDKDQAREFLNRLCGRWHRVLTGYHLFHRPGGERVSNSVESKVLLKKLRPAEIEAYISTSEPYDKAGAYAAQGIGAGLIQEIQGSYTNVVGLPLAELLEELLRLGVIEPKTGE